MFVLSSMPIEMYDYLLRHTKLLTTQIYARVEETKISEDIQSLLIRFKNEEAIITSNTLLSLKK